MMKKNVLTRLALAAVGVLWCVVPVTAQPLATKVVDPDAAATSLPAELREGVSTTTFRPDRTLPQGKQQRMPDLDPQSLFRQSAKRDNYVLAPRDANENTHRMSAPVRRSDAAEGDVPNIYGVVQYSTASSLGGYGIKNFFLTPHNASETFKWMGSGMGNSETMTYWGGVIKDDIYYGSIRWDLMANYVQVLTFTYDMRSQGPWNMASNKSSMSLDNLPLTMAYDPTDDTIYSLMLTNSGLGVALASVDYSTGLAVQTQLHTLPGNYKNYQGLCVTPEGQLYCIAVDIDTSGDQDVVTDSRLIKINKATGEVTSVGSTGLIPVYIGDATIDKETGRMYWTVSTSDRGSLAEVDLSTGTATVLFDYAGQEQIVGIDIQAAKEYVPAPGKPTNLYPDFEEGSLSGVLRFRTPKNYADGTQAPADGPLKWTVEVYGRKMAEGESTFDTAVEVPLTMETSRDYTFVVYCSNEGGVGSRAQYNCFVGIDLLNEARDVTVENLGEGNLQVSWWPENTTVNGNYVPMGNITFNVYRITDDGDPVLIKTGVPVNTNDNEKTSVIDNVEVSTTAHVYKYAVAQVWNGNESERVISQSIKLVEFGAPYLNTLSTQADFDELSVYRGESPKYWEFSSGYAKVADDYTYDKDDWLVTPGLHLKAGMAYEFSVKAWCRSTSYPETVEVKYGKSGAPAGLTLPLVAAVELNSSSQYDPDILTGTVVPDEDGVYYIGIHAISPRDRWELMVDDISLGEGAAIAAPAAVTNLTATADASGALKATVAFNAPSTSADGGNLAAISRIDVVRNEQVVKTFDNPTPGDALSFEDTGLANGVNKWSVTVYGAGGASVENSVETYVGVYAPVAVTGITIKEAATPGEVLVTWDAVTADVEGHSLEAEQVVYNVYMSDAEEILALEGVEGTTATFAYTDQYSQALAQVKVTAVTAGGEGAGHYSEMIPVGKPYDGINETFAHADTHYLWGVNTAGGASWALMSDNSGVYDYDGNNGFVACYGGAVDVSADFFSGKVSLEGMEMPALTFYVWPHTNGQINDIENLIEVLVRECGTEAWTTIYSAPVKDLGTELKWNRLLVELDEFEGKTIQFTIRSITKTHLYTILDKIFVGNVLSNDLWLKGFDTPVKVRPAIGHSIAVDVQNIGRDNFGAFSVELYADGDLTYTENVEGLRGGDAMTVNFTHALHPLKEEASSYKAKVVAAGDQDESNNFTAERTPYFFISNLPYVTDLAGTPDGNNAVLTWSHADHATAEDEEIIETFESGESFAKEFEGWTFVDLDQGRVGGFGSFEIPGITAGSTKGSYFIFDNTLEGCGPSFACPSGNKFLASLFNYDGGVVDDWAISPLLNGHAQTVSFMAASYDNHYPELIEILVSFTDTDTESFTHVEGFESVMLYREGWKYYSFPVPEGARYFAIRSHSTNAFMLMLDDFEFTPAITADSHPITGYNVYRNGVKVNDAPVVEPTFTDEMPAANTAAAAADGDDTPVTNDRRFATYRVTTLFEQGESRGSNEVSVQTTSAEDIACGLMINVAPGLIIVTNAPADAVTEVYDVDGRLIYRGTDATIAVPAGIYLVKVSATVAKVRVS